ncbi:LOW QUALITY PROTEIN: Adenylosuccinate synthetase [Frankliniella fusca]|uniref:Adenylosuccinate synthetase n=1 Tax=Frankliniella fusca TaxID=407009 RepID=A0AAE1HET2_9NEOP|nr:LOW QUALITY PROTEIN: Adenylosuccinate synthetase [Frankliniella fusca]
MREGEEVLNSGFVVSVGLKERKDSVAHIQALVLRTSGLQQHPYLVELWVDLDKDYGSRLLKDQSQEYQCKAGQSEKCKHVVAVMLYLARTDKTGLDDLSCTDVEQQWGALKATTLKEYEAKSLKEFCHVKLPNDVYVSQMPTVTPEMEKKWADRLSRCAPSSEYSLVFSNLRGAGLTDSGDTDDPVNPDSVQENYTSNNLMTFRSWRIMHELNEMTEQNADVTFPESIKLAQAQQRTQIWYAARKNRLTASSARSQYTYYSNSNADWNKRYQTLYHSTSKGDTDTINGLKYEGAARERYEDLNSYQVLETGIIVHPLIPWLGSSLDGTVMDENGKFSRNIEIKK